ncbi:MAG: hypothetical protein UU51_C0024G0006 [Microgenomates group bacterium GW2011_GWC1_41_20]|uniref:Uncharacterized protein n=5 Tax=Candidatus Woeseibacteriota TaxID=1752722 RepID=A0A0G0Z9N8_9BACT|nr:MAG: hypothetical protein UU39_C0025G0009 [Candidatus Woesebacteria bacterium GW2011_GWD1_41_12]KKR99782.1 MAG: hypothetical protein UU51_C0024G0006 [Microgenomates group bacterium GW2011_GWC1_41_20]KKS04353.1 MAG: hypothetical protein UU57_C0021G0007 [Candidatus Woesebacteria bacterium GW2011_GWE1_41_24]KKS18781.1 MAG: hypothetical protein UU74_C0001G0013 [Candidatus Woesebacteria bacterium GW2011_GWA1_41_7]OGM81434.1 MAG: hypothetical protein A2393_02515 [Candidatus Woesebacteria bacterium
MQKIGDIVNKYKLEDKDKYVSREFQKYAYDLAVDLNDLPHKSLYMKLAKETPRILLEKARTFVKDATNANSKGRLFMWKLAQLKAEAAKNNKAVEK